MEKTFGEKEKTLEKMKKHPAKTQGKMKMKSCIFSKIWKEISLKNISPRIFFFFEENYFQEIFSRFWKTPKIS